MGNRAVGVLLRQIERQLWSAVAEAKDLLPAEAWEHDQNPLGQPVSTAPCLGPFELLALQIAGDVKDLVRGNEE